MTSPASQRHVANIGETGQRRRRLGGIFWLLIAIAGSSWFWMKDPPQWWCVGLVIPFSLAALGMLQAREKT